MNLCILPEQPWPQRGRNQRRILCVFPRYAHSFGTFQHAYRLMPGVRAFMPPQGILLTAACLPPQWQVRFVDENIRPVHDREYQWADAVFISGMHVQRPQIERINQLAQQHGKITVLGGPSVSACPQYYPRVDVLHVGEVGDATTELVARLDHSIQRPAHQLVLTTRDRLPMERMPIPAYHLVDLRRYFLGSVQFSSGCPFLCEFCDIPALYGRRPRVKSPGQIVSELDAMLAHGLRNAVYFVDDNFIADPQAAKNLLPELIAWQQRTGYQLNLCCEATLNIAQHPDLLAMMREARFTTVFCGIETPEPHALEGMKKKQNLRSPILDAVRTLNSHGLEVVSGIILGLDTDTPDTPARHLEFIEQSQIPLLTINLLYALPRTPLYDRLEREGRLVDDPHRASNVVFKSPYEQVLATWRDVTRQAYDPPRLFERLRAQTHCCFPNRLEPRRKVTPAMLGFGARLASRVLWHAGVRADYRRLFWQACRPLLRQGRIEEVMHIGVVTQHVIRFARECAGGQAEASFYHDPNRAQRPERRPAVPRASVSVSAPIPVTIAARASRRGE